MANPTLPNPISDNVTRFEAAPDPDGTLIPIPSQAPAGVQIRDDASIVVSARQPNGYYVSIYNGPPNPPSAITEFVVELFTEAGMEGIEKVLLVAAPAVLEFALSVAGVLASVLTTSPILSEHYYRGTMDDGTQVTYVVLIPK